MEVEAIRCLRFMSHLTPVDLAKVPSRGWDTANEATQGTNGLPPSRGDVRIARNLGWPTGGDPEGNGVPRVVVGVTPHQGGRKRRPQGEGAQVT